MATPKRARPKQVFGPRRGRNGGYRTTIYKPTSSYAKWRVVTFDCNDRRVERSFAMQERAQQQAAMWEQYNEARLPIAVEAQADGGIAPSRRASIDVHATEWLEAHRPRKTAGGTWIGWSQNYWDRNEWLLRVHLKPTLLPRGVLWGDLEPDQWTKADSQHLLAALSVKLAPWTVRGARVVLTGLETWLHNTKALPPMMAPASGVALPRLASAEVDDDGDVVKVVCRDDLPSDEACARMFDAMDAAKWRDDSTMYRLDHRTGLRVAELISLRPRDFDLERRTVQVVRQYEDKRRDYFPPKNGKRREAFWPPSLDDRVGELVTRRIDQDGPDCLVWPGRTGRPRNDSTLRQRWLVAANEAEWPFLEPLARGAEFKTSGAKWVGSTLWTRHTLRHVAATWLLFDTELDPAEVAKILGHYSADFTLRLYVGRRGDLAQRAHAALAGW